MALKTFNLDAEIYKQFSEHCKQNGISMSKKIENFIREEIEKISPPKKQAPRTPAIRNHSFSKYC
ncbi:MAG: hypothetical protein ABIG28_03645 [archaeon]